MSQEEKLALSRRRRKKQDVKIEWRTAAEILEERRNVERLPTLTPIDELIGGGIEKGEVVEFYGEFGSGKTQICFTLACTCLGHVFFIDAEGTFKPERLAEIASNRGVDVEELFSRVHLFQPLTSEELMGSVNNIPKDVEVSLIIVDGLTSLFREEYIGRETLTERQGLIRVFIRDLKRYARDHKVAVVVTNQVYADPGSSTFLPLEYRERAVGGHTVYHSIDNRFFVRKASGGTRIAKLVDSSMYPPGSRPFKITSRGVETTEKRLEQKEGEGGE